VCVYDAAGGSRLIAEKQINNSCCREIPMERFSSAIPPVLSLNSCLINILHQYINISIIIVNKNVA